jgi:hypothetical protein
MADPVFRYYGALDCEVGRLTGGPGIEVVILK